MLPIHREIVFNVGDEVKVKINPNDTDMIDIEAGNASIEITFDEMMSVLKVFESLIKEFS